MTITLIVEDGTGVANANTYADLAYARAFATNTGLVGLPTDDEAAKAALLRAMAYIESRPYQGYPSSATQALVWPRKGVLYSGYQLLDNYIPEPIKKAQVVAATLIGNGIELLPTVSGQFVTEETVGPITTKYSDEYLASSTGLTVFSEIDVYLNPFCNIAGGYRLTPSFGF